MNDKICRPDVCSEQKADIWDPNAMVEGWLRQIHRLL